jgi:CHASE3 domain sensor protein
LHERDGQPGINTEYDDPIREDEIDPELATTSAADVESAGRSCLVILVLAIVILILLIAWVIFGITGGAGR